MSDKIVIPCSECGSNMAVPGTAAGKKVRCPKCKTVVAIPGGSSSFNDAGGPDVATPEPQPRRARSVSKPADNTGSSAAAAPKQSGSISRPDGTMRPVRKPKIKSAPSEDDWLDDDMSSYGSSAGEWDSYGNPGQLPAALPPRSKPKNSGSSAPTLRGSGNEPPAASTRSRATSGSAMTGILMMAGAVVWFFGGLFFGVIFFYPPVLFVLGFIALVKGVMSTE